MVSGRADDNLNYLLNSSFTHNLFDTSFSLAAMLQVTDKLHASAKYKIEASSPVGLQASLYYTAQAMSTLNSDDVSGDGVLEGLLQIGSFHTNGSYIHSYRLLPLNREGQGESTFYFSSPFIQVHNAIHGVYANSELNIVSQTSAQRDLLKHIAELKYEDAKLTLKSNAAARLLGKSLNNKAELVLSSHMAIVKIELHADDDKTRSLDSNGLDINSEGSIMVDTDCPGLHEASATVSRNGLSTSGADSIQCRPISLEMIFSGVIENNGATLSSRTKAVAKESGGELNIEGKFTPQKASLSGVFKGHAHDASTRNSMSIVVNQRSLHCSSNSMLALKEMTMENSHSLTLTLWTLTLHSKTSNFIHEDIFYTQNINVNLKPFVMSFDMTNNLKFHDVIFNTEGHMKLEPFEVDLSGSTRGAYSEEHNIKHTFQLNYSNKAGGLNYNMSGIVMNAQLSHSCQLEFAGFASVSNCETQIKSELLRFDSTIRTMAVPFSVAVDARVNSDGEINHEGKHTGQLHSKFLLKAEPIALAYSHDSRLTTLHMLPSGESSTNVNNRFDGLLTPSGQLLTWKMNSNWNNHAYNHNISLYNNPERIGYDFSGVMLTDSFSKYSVNNRSLPEIQDFNMAGGLKYEKSSDCHMIVIPFIESIPTTFEQLKNTLIEALESIQQYINNLDINQLLADFRVKLNQLPKQVNDFMQEINLARKIDQVKAKLDFLMAEFAITMDDLVAAMNHLRGNFEDMVTDLDNKIRNHMLAVKDFVQSGHFADKITNVLSQFVNQFQAFDKEYKIKQLLIKALDAIQDIVGQIELQMLTKYGAAWVQELDSNYLILETVKDKVLETKQTIENFDISLFIDNVKNYILSIDWSMYVEHLSYQITSSQISQVIESMNDVIVNWIDEYEIPNKLNAKYSYVRDLILKYDLDDKFKEIMDHVLILIEKLKIDKTVQSMVDALRSVDAEFVYQNIMQFLRKMIVQLRATDFKRSMDYLNEPFFSILKSMKEFDYSTFVDEANKMIATLTNHINNQIKMFEIVQKIEAVREFVREIQSSVFTTLDELKKTKVTDALKKLKKVIDITFYNDVKVIAKDILEDVRVRILDMDFRGELYIYLQRASVSYRNIVAYVSLQCNQLIEKIRKVAKNNEVINQVRQAVDKVLAGLQMGEIEVPTFIVPLTDLVIPAFTIKLNKLQEISIPALIEVPEFTILNHYRISAFIIDFDAIKAKILALIDDIADFEIQMPDPEQTFGDLKVLYLFKLPDLTFPEITLNEIIFRGINIPKLNLTNFKISKLPIPEIKFPEISSNICIPVFSKLQGEFRVNSPLYTLVTTGRIENSTSTTKHPRFTVTITSHATSPIEMLEYSFEAKAQLEAPRMKRLLLNETAKVTHKTFSTDHEGSLTLNENSAEASAKTTINATTQIYKSDLVNTVSLTLKNTLSAATNTTYVHNLYIPSSKTSSQASVKHSITATLESGRITVTSETTGNGKWAIQGYSDEGTHTSNLKFYIDYHSAKIAFVGETNSEAFKTNQILTAESMIFSHIKVNARCESEVPSVMKSVVVLLGEADVGDLKVALTASHDAEFNWNLIGSLANSVQFMVHPFEIVCNVRNKLNSRIFLPLKLTSKVDFQHDYGIILQSEEQSAKWFALARFNRYNYNHNFTAENNEMELFVLLSANGEANLDFLTVPLSIPGITLPYLEIKTPPVKELSLWEDAGFKSLLTTPQQSFDMTLKLHYHKNLDTYSFGLHLQPVYPTISDNVNIIQAQFERYRDEIVALLKNSYNKAKSQ